MLLCVSCRAEDRIYTETLVLNRLTEHYSLSRQLRGMSLTTLTAPLTPVKPTYKCVTAVLVTEVCCDTKYAGECYRAAQHAGTRPKP